ncbi:MAG: nuclear transport factor 2 family protein [Proteobacteria bacterium]|nr:nuclear transport factor 2 family protein [Pseudomonadota bacterium]MBI3497521.1 nuclear transport factor 2 family protein [Pseudomonadota bacterium]
MSDWSTCLERYAAAYEQLTPERLPVLAALLAEDVEFRDPFNAIAGRAAVVRLFHHMFETLDGPSFAVRDRAVGSSACYIGWRMRFRRHRRPEPWQIEGVSMVCFDREGLVRLHVDHWDAASQVYEHVPLLGAILRLVKRRLAAGA